MIDFTFVTYAAMPDLDPDDRLAFDLLAQRGFRMQAAVWDDRRVDWSRAGACILRSTWDYNLRHEEFLAWTERVAAVSRMWNSPSLVRWNSNKTDLRDLEAAGVAIVPTAWIKRGSKADLSALLGAAGWELAVIKPSVGLSTYGVRKVSARNDADGQSHLELLLRTHDVMVQPYIASVESHGERALIFIAGQYSHAARKTAFQQLLPTGEAGEQPVAATPSEISAATRAMAALPEAPLYARVDLVHDAAGEPLVIELELVEPTLFLGMDPQAPARFADALSALVR
ncbi:MAG TPA: hypothetical protein VKR99_06420 [Candidatus Eremiobacteraceae bacterium]|nr:hypothetical protein [Candidatus Eremiobacteraceae bacterium]